MQPTVLTPHPPLPAATAPRRSLAWQLSWAILLVLLAASWKGADMRPFELFRDSGNMATYAAEFFPPNFGEWRMYAQEMVVTLQIALWGTALAVVSAVPMALLASANIVPWWIYLPHLVWSATPLTGGNTSGPAKPVQRCSPNGPGFAGRRFPRDAAETCSRRKFMALKLEEITHLLEAKGQRQYGREAVSQLAHALQCAQLAEQAGETPETIVAALLHDLGHLLAAEHADEARAAQQQRDDLHQYIALPFLRGLFAPAVLEPIRLHVDAKRYLCAAQPGYWNTLSPASKRSLELQGGIYTDAQAQRFLAQPFAPEAVRLRRYDDEAKVPGKATPPLVHFMDLARSLTGT